mmetsp:Transcript_2365/g.9071  ORF Transcript_2365/g.9071 Transcript_2365/m.9071 type:complete len:130 (-) Transcript_2365:81-470(-)
MCHPNLPLRAPLRVVRETADNGTESALTPIETPVADALGDLDVDDDERDALRCRVALGFDAFVSCKGGGGPSVATRRRKKKRRRTSPREGDDEHEQGGGGASGGARRRRPPHMMSDTAAEIPVSDDTVR